MVLPRVVWQGLHRPDRQQRAQLQLDPPVFGDPYTDGYLNHIYRKTGTAVVCCYLFGVFMPIRIRGVNVIWYLLACSLAPLPFVGAETYRFFSYVYLPLVVSLLEGYLVIRGASHTDRVTGVVFVVGSGLATGYRVFMGVSDFELCPHGIADMFYKNYSLVHVFYILMFVITISRKYAQRFDEATRLSAELERTRDGLEQTVRLRTHDLEVSYEQLKAQKEESENFLSAVLHNIKTPLFALMGYCDMLAEAEAPAQKRSYLNTVHESINYIRDMVDNLSTAFRLERDPGLMRLQPMDLHTTLRSVEATTVGRTCFTETQVGFSIDPGGPARARRRLLSAPGPPKHHRQRPAPLRGERRARGGMHGDRRHGARPHRRQRRRHPPRGP